MLTKNLIPPLDVVSPLGRFFLGAELDGGIPLQHLLERLRAQLEGGNGRRDAKKQGENNSRQARPSPRLAFASPIPHSPSLDAYGFSEPSVDRDDYGDLPSDFISEIINGDSKIRPAGHHHLALAVLVYTLENVYVV